MKKQSGIPPRGFISGAARPRGTVSRKFSNGRRFGNYLSDI
ncbi:hypothetical protein [Succinimonas amylolytica]|nr:hypothetical protein [Succinimonas amylolytica]